MNNQTPEQEALIQTVELGIDWGLEVSEEAVEEYYRITEEGR